ncbi:MAG TPA: flagellar basal-body rod protein FlgG [Bacteroidota bacterium]|nr:flagellar basal-body rod protein FlgG [Bacteroidota bacterium]
MNRSLRTAATGMYAQQLNVDIISNNLANVNTTGFKKSRVEFQDLMYQTLKPSTVTEQGGGSPMAPMMEIQVGNGTQTVATLKNFLQGDITPTSADGLDVAIQGDGFFQLKRPDGTLAYTRDGSFKLSADGMIVTSEGYIVDPEIRISANTEKVIIGKDGSVDAIETGSAEPVKLGQIELARFVNPAGLRAIGSNMLVETTASGQPITGTAGSAGFGMTLQGHLEASNVDVVEEMVSMITAQRAYEVNSKTIKTVEDMLTMANNLKR